jgi:hypothetical protein
MPLRTSVPTDKALLMRAQQVPLAPLRDRAIFYHGDEGRRQAEHFVRQHVGHTRLDELLKQSVSGVELLRVLGAPPWAEKEEVWWELSRKLARAASGDVHCFGPERLSRTQPVATHQSGFTPRAYAHTVFEKVELPELDNNPRVETIFYNGAAFE